MQSFLSTHAILVLVLLVASSGAFSTGRNPQLLFQQTKDALRTKPCVSRTSSRSIRIHKAVSTGSTFGTGASSSTGPDDNESESARRQERTLYDILGASITDSRTELKQKYVALAKQSHPDAVRNGPDPSALSASFPPEQHDFTEIAAAWSILSDPTQRRRYDRSLQAEQLAENIADFVSSRAVPVTDFGVKALERVALPFLRRTTATTLASIQAAFQENRDISKTFQSAMEAARHAGRAVDQLEWLERAEQLEQAAVEEYKKVVALQNELSRKIEERMKLSLHTTNSGMTSGEATVVLENFNQTLQHVSKSVWERANPLRLSAEQEIGSLRRLEGDFVQRQKTDAFAQAKYLAAIKERMTAKKVLNEAEKEEERARMVYEAAIVEAARKRQMFELVTIAEYELEQVAKKSSVDLEVMSEAVVRQSETVRHALRQKERTVYKHHQKGVMSVQPLKQHDNSFAAFAQRAGYEMSEAIMRDSSGIPEFTQSMQQEPYSIIPDCSTKAENEARLAELEIRRQEERALAEQVQEMEINAAKLLSRAKKLRIRAANANNDPEQ